MAARMTSYRRMRRHARQIRRGGMQPMMVVNGGDQMPETVGVVLLRVAWRYRSELAPVFVAVMVAGMGEWLHISYPQWWQPALYVAVVATWALACFGGKLVPSVIERLYAATTTLAAGMWVSAAALLGPS